MPFTSVRLPMVLIELCRIEITILRCKRHRQQRVLIELCRIEIGLDVGIRADQDKVLIELCRIEMIYASQMLNNRCSFNRTL